MRRLRPLRLGFGAQPDSYPAERPWCAGIDVLDAKGIRYAVRFEDGVVEFDATLRAAGFIVPQGSAIEFRTGAGTATMDAVEGKGGPLWTLDLGGVSLSGSALTGWQFVGDAEVSGALVAASLFVQTGASIGGTVAEPTTISPGAFGSNQNNWSPTGITGARNVRLSASAGALSITGISASQSGGRLLRLFNVGSNAVTLTHESASSSAANRFRCPGGAGFSLAADGAVDLWYDSASSRWRLVR